MAKRNNQQHKALVDNKSSNDLGRGVIKDSFLKALVTSKVYKMQVVKAKKGKGAYERKAKNSRRESYLMAA